MSTRFPLVSVPVVPAVFTEQALLSNALDAVPGDSAVSTDTFGKIVRWHISFATFNTAIMTDIADDKISVLILDLNSALSLIPY